DRVERGIRDEVVDGLPHHRQGALAVGDHLHAAALELLGQVPGARIDRLVVVVVDVDGHVVQGHCSCPFGSPGVTGPWAGGKLGCRFSKKLLMPSMKSGRCMDSCISFSASSL